MKKILKLFASLSMALSLVAVNVHASETVEVKNEEELLTALENKASDITLTDDITLTNFVDGHNTNILIEHSVTIHGNGNTVSGSNARANFRIGVKGEEDTPLTVTFDSITIVNSYSNGGRCIETRRGDLTLNITNSTLTTNNTYGQTITIGGSCASKDKPVDLNITSSTVEAKKHYAVVVYNPIDAMISDTTLSGYSALYFKGEDGSLGSEGSAVIFENDSLITGKGVSNESFGVIVFEDNDVLVDLYGSKIEANGVTNSDYHCFDFSYLDFLCPNYDENNPVVVKNNKVKLMDADIYVSDTGASLANKDTNNSIVIYDATSNIDVTEYVYEDSDIVEKDGKFIVCSHGMGDTINTKEPTCTDKGYTGDEVCGVCGKVLVEGEEIPALEHNHVLDETTVKEPTCTDKGYTGDKKCECGDTIKGEEIPTLEHNHVLDETTVKEPTCTDKGYTGDKKCECGDTIKGEEIPALEHNHVLDETTIKDPTCTEEGYTGDKKCTCGDTVKGEVVKATGHKYVNGECACGEKEEVSSPGESVPALPEPEINTEIEKLPTVDTTKPVEEVTVGTNETSKEVINDTVNQIIENVKEDKEVTNVSKEVVEAIKEEYEKGNDVDLVTEVVVKAIEEKDVNKETITLIEQTVKGSKVVQYLDLSVLVNVVVNDEVKTTGEVTELSKPVTFTIALPKDVATVKDGYTRTYYVIREHDGKTDKLPVTVNKDGSLSFTTDKFSTYALTYVDSKLGGTPSTSDNSFVGMYILMATLSLATLFVLKKKEELSK